MVSKHRRVAPSTEELGRQLDAEQRRKDWWDQANKACIDLLALMVALAVLAAIMYSIFG